ncbi:TPA: hypothetical protein HA338_05470 [Methanosarcina acetivorans]|uniref:Uncharacterized protein n=2 Tax=Methanosarcina acetivorans TaxID=2214 RepID=Q8TPU5_METAC|nr:hypothetical protein [Methanosarcina acetivorans]AAM05215.1 predicted protein [Methanosarcina acetivorans C2A]HIH93494.1 hypothetical protein [Methanosarcina acetivorans]
MHRVKPGDPASPGDTVPIDSVVLAIQLKRLLLVNSSNLVFRVLSPFIHVVSGTLFEITDYEGNKRPLATPESTNAFSI